MCARCRSSAMSGTGSGACCARRCRRPSADNRTGVADRRAWAAMRRRSPMSSLDTLMLLELAHGRPDLRADADRRPPLLLSWLRSASGWLAALGQRSLLLIGVLLIWEIAPRFGLVDRVFLPPFSEVIAAGW